MHNIIANHSKQGVAVAKQFCQWTKSEVSDHNIDANAQVLNSLEKIVKVSQKF